MVQKNLEVRGPRGHLPLTHRWLARDARIVRDEAARADAPLDAGRRLVTKQSSPQVSQSHAERLVKLAASHFVEATTTATATATATVAVGARTGCFVDQRPKATAETHSRLLEQDAVGGSVAGLQLWLHRVAARAAHQTAAESRELALPRRRSQLRGVGCIPAAEARGAKRESSQSLV